MATISFAKKPSAPEPTTAVAVVPKQEVAVASTFSSPQLSGEFTAKDLSIPYLAIGQKSGKLCEDNPNWIGQWIYDKAIPLSNEIRVVVCHLAKHFEEALEYGSEEIAQRFDKIEEARAAGVDVKEVGTVDLLIEMDNGDLEDFASFSEDGKLYLPARYVARSSAYGAAIKLLYTDLGRWLKGDFKSGFYKFGTEKRTGQKGSWFVPKLKADGKVPDALRAKIAERFAS